MYFYIEIIHISWFNAFTEVVIKMDFKERLRELRQQRGYSQEELAKQLGLSKSAISMYERGARTPDFETMELLADFFNVDMNYILGKEMCSTYYIKPEAAEAAKELYERDELRVLFDAARDVSEEDIRYVATLLEKLKQKEGK